MLSEMGQTQLDRYGTFHLNGILKSSQNHRARKRKGGCQGPGAWGHGGLLFSRHRVAVLQSETCSGGGWW